MKNIVFKHIKINNFCAISSFSHQLHSKSIIKGRNATGKSTVKKAIPHMSEYKKGEFMGYAQALVDLKSERLANEAEKEVEREEMIGEEGK